MSAAPIANTKITNAAQLPLQTMAQFPEQTALLLLNKLDDSKKGNKAISYGQLNQHIQQLQHALTQSGFKAGDRIVVLLRPSINLYALLIALLSLGLVVVFIDPKMGSKRIGQTLRKSQCKAIIGGRRLLRWRWLMPTLWQIPAVSIEELLQPQQPAHQSHTTSYRDCTDSDNALITYTSGSTGLPKGAARTHQSLITQHQALEKLWRDQSGTTVMTQLPVMALHFLSSGVSTFFVNLNGNLLTPNQLQLLVQKAKQQQVTRIIGFPKLVEILTRELLAKEQIWTEINYIAIGGSSVSVRLCRQMKLAFPNARIEVIYGATEAEPISSASIDEIINESMPNGYLVGKPASVAEVLIVPTMDSAKGLDEGTLLARKLPPGVIGEVLVKGPHVIKQYVDNDELTQSLKIPTTDGQVWHRTGDSGYFDGRGRLWLTGRIKDIIELANMTIYPYPLECRVEMLPGVINSVLIACRGKATLALVTSAKADRQHITDEVQRICQQLEVPLPRLCWVNQLPLDNRHHSKVDRQLLRQQLS
ncbi:AMP-binding protein [Zooshikella harenae]|uniref:AMP-binding protein n=1 Tax=Zooshikella harenae TaxID=2827238 RepID=A0ABS5ZFM3_9GAMM|nr:AMP-binding protein [Zooshikella harenae]MBU2712081.1 AMP-binding protein [Zooshikella harenae]